MPVPEFYRFMRPTLEALGDGQIRHWSALEPLVAARLNITPEARAELVPSGIRTRVADRLQWALTYLRQAALVEKVGVGTNRITERGSAYLSRAPEVITADDLTEFAEFVAFRQRSRGRKPTEGDAQAGPRQTTESTPGDIMQSAYDEHSAALAEEVIEAVKAMTPARFESLIVQLMLKMGYGIGDESGRTVGRAGDEGIDGIIEEDKLGLDKIYLQAKRWTDTKVGRKEVQAFVGALSGQGASKGVFITASEFSADAESYAQNNKGFTVSLVDGRRLAQLMIDHDLGVASLQAFALKRLDSDFFAD